MPPKHDPDFERRMDALLKRRIRAGRERGFASEGLERVWTDYRRGDVDSARAQLLRVWHGGVDALAGRQAARVAVKLLERLGPCFDDADRWQELPAELEVARAGGLDGFCWSVDRTVAESLAAQFGLPLHDGRVNKRDVLAFITERGEEEVVVRPERIRLRH